MTTGVGGLGGLGHAAYAAWNQLSGGPPAHEMTPSPVDAQAATAQQPAHAPPVEPAQESSATRAALSATQPVVPSVAGAEGAGSPAGRRVGGEPVPDGQQAGSDGVAPSQFDPVAVVTSTSSAAPGRRKVEVASQLADYVRTLVSTAQDQYKSLQQIGSRPIAVPNIPGGAEFVATAQNVMQLQTMALSYQLEMGAAEQVRSTGKAVMDKFTEMKD